MPTDKPLNTNLDTPSERDRSLLRQQALLLACMYLGYAGFMLIKTSIVVSGPALLAETALGLDKAAWGSILAAGTMGGILGKFISGWSADRWGGKKVFTTGLLISTFGAFNFSLRGEFLAFAAIYFTILMANSSGWPSMAKLIGNWFQSRQFGRVWGLISTASRVGTITATFAVSALLRILDWRQVLWVSAGIGSCLFLLAFFLIKERPGKNEVAREQAAESPGPESYLGHPFYGKTLRQALTSSLRNKRFLLICAAMMGLTILWDFLNFVPLYLKDSLQLSVADAALATSSFPIGSLLSVLIGGFIFDKLGREKVTKIIGVYLGLAVASLVFILSLPQLNLSPQTTVMATLMALFIFGFTVSPAYYLPMSIFSIDYGGPYSGFLIALLDATGYLASVFFSLRGSRLLDQGTGWTQFLTLLIGVAIFAWATTVLFLHGESKVATQKLATSK